jgi:hypothetical protein
VRRASLTTLCIALACLAGLAGCGGSSEKVPPTASYLSNPAPGYRYVQLSQTAEAQVRKQFGIGLQVADQLVVRRVMKGKGVAAALVIVRLKKGQDPNDVATGFEERAAGNATDVKIGGKDAKLVHAGALYAVYDTDVRTFMAVFAQNPAEAEKIAVPVVR